MEQPKEEGQPIAEPDVQEDCYIVSFNGCQLTQKKKQQKQIIHLQEVSQHDHDHDHDHGYGHVQEPEQVNYGAVGPDVEEGCGIDVH